MYKSRAFLLTNGMADRCVAYSIGASLISFGLPIACYAFAFLCNDVTGCPAPSLLDPRKLFTPGVLSRQAGWEHALDVLKTEVGWPGWSGLINIEAIVGTLFWYGLSLFLYVLLPAQEVQGTELRTGGRLKYRFNGMLPRHQHRLSHS